MPAVSREPLWARFASAQLIYRDERRGARRSTDAASVARFAKTILHRIRAALRRSSWLAASTAQAYSGSSAFAPSAGSALRLRFIQPQTLVQTREAILPLSTSSVIVGRAAEKLFQTASM